MGCGTWLFCERLGGTDSRAENTKEKNGVERFLFDQNLVAISIDEHLLIIDHLLTPIIGITIVSKILVPSVCEPGFLSRLERTPETFCPRTHLNRIRKYSVHIATVETIDLLEDIEIVEESSIIHDEVRPANERNGIEWESDTLIDREGYIEKYGWNDHPVDEWNREDITNMSPIPRN